MGRSDVKIKGLCDVIRKTSLDIHSYLRHGHLEKVYERALANRLQKLGLKVKNQHPIQGVR